MKLLVVAPRVGATWVREGLMAFRRQPLAFFSLFMLFMTAAGLFASVPVVGGALAAALAPAGTLALMVAAERASRLPPGRTAPDGRPVSAVVFMDALRAVRERVRPLAMLGALYVAASLLVGLVAMALVGNPFAEAVDAHGVPKADVVFSARFTGSMLLLMVLQLPALLAFWHAPALVHWYAVPPVKSLFFSIVTCLRNFGAMTVYGLVWFGVGMLLMLALSMAANLAMLIVGAVGAGLVIGGLFVLGAMVLGSTWFSFRDCFQAD